MNISCKQPLFFSIVTLLFTLTFALTKPADAGEINTNTKLSWDMSNSLAGVNREIYLINAQAQGVIAPGNIWIGGYGDGALFYQDHKQKSQGHSSQSSLVATTQDVDLSNLVRKYFLAHGNVISTGLLHNGLNGSVSFMNGGQANNSNLYTANNRQINNFAMNLSYTFGTNQQYLKLGAGYLNGSLSTLQRDNAQTNPAYDVNLSALYQDVQFLIEYASTFYSTAFTDKPGSALATGMAYHFKLQNKPATLAIQYSWANASFIPQNQTAISDQNSYSIEFRQQIIENLWLGTQLNYIDNPVGISNVNELDIRVMDKVLL